MQKLIIKPTSKSFGVICEDGLIEFKGCSIVNDPKAFFIPVQNWITDYIKVTPENTIIRMEIDYIDSSSTKFVYEILKSLEKIIELDKSVYVNWCYDVKDPEILEIGEILAGRLKIPFNFIQL